ncbi:ComF family protein [Streptomyces luteolifulvus]|uniref:ComF family protein n=1 Tax=Streptomyces luteolifulvus TaxID=2615112 RepID=A0A6H9UT94_9ACTN|nr:ComF family protein [Streptomyces luteolifulvus]KAB1141897.1 ComF family protein [Streptomyces luteolifulvus]
MRGWWQDLTDLVLPAECGGCGRPRTVLCPECRDALSGAAPCRVRPVPQPPGLPVVHAAARYADAVRAVLLAHKERGALALAAPLGAALAGAVGVGVREALARADGCLRTGPPETRTPGGGAVLLVPVPSSRGAVRARGHDPARRIALAAAGELRRSGTPARVAAVLRQRRTVADQSGLNSRQRLDNLAGALAVAPAGARLLFGGPVVLVDDLMTTGASLAEAARAVRAARAAEAAYIGVEPLVYAAATRESTEERVQRMQRMQRMQRTQQVRRREPIGGSRGSMREEPERAGVDRAHDQICAAVVAATPDSFEMNRN